MTTFFKSDFNIEGGILALRGAHKFALNLPSYTDQIQSKLIRSITQPYVFTFSEECVIINTHLTTERKIL